MEQAFPFQQPLVHSGAVYRGRSNPLFEILSTPFREAFGYVVKFLAALIELFFVAGFFSVVATSLSFVHSDGSIDPGMEKW
jgi:hypothetical protein